MKKRIVSLTMVLALCLMLLPASAFAAEDSGAAIGTGGLCAHHTEHDEACGYVEGIAESPCTHEHSEDCYTEVTSCTHEHTGECYPASDSSIPEDGTTSSEDESVADTMSSDDESGKDTTLHEAAEPTQCSHVCSEESGCIKQELDCKHEHNEECGYAPAVEGQPCTYVCTQCGMTEITAWSWVDAQDAIDLEKGGVLALSASADSPVPYKDIVALLPTEITATTENGTETLSLDSWSCDDYPAEGAYTGSYAFHAVLPEGYGLAADAPALTVTVELDDEVMLMAEGQHSHCICGASHKDIGEHKVEASVSFDKKLSCSSSDTWLQVDNNSAGKTTIDNRTYWVLPAGSYYLAGDITLDKSILIESGEVNICLNGHKLRLNHGTVQIWEVIQLNGGTLNLTDCQDKGTVCHVDGNPGRGVTVENGTSFTLYGGTICNNEAYASNSTTAQGGGVYIGSSSTFNMYGGKIHNNWATVGSNGTESNRWGYGGGVYCAPNGTFNLLAGEITENQVRVDSNNGGAGMGGGVFNKGTFTMSGDSKISKNFIASNSSMKQYGGGVCNCDSPAKFVMNGGEISGNYINSWYSSPACGGGVYNNSKFEFTGGTITGNRLEAASVNVFGGGVYNDQSGNFTMSSGIISNNTTKTNGASGGGGVCIYRSTFTMNSGEISGNQALTYTASASPNACDGGGIYFDSGTIGNFTLSGGTITGNTTKGKGAGICIYSDASQKNFHLSGNPVVWDNTTDGKQSNLYMDQSYDLKSPLTKGAKVGLSLLRYNNNVMVNVDSSITDDMSQYFVSDDSAYTLETSGSTIIRKSAHIHDWQFDKKDGNNSKIFVTCKGTIGTCDYKNDQATVSISTDQTVYDCALIKEAPKAVLTYSDNWPTDLPKAEESAIKYWKSTDGGNSYTNQITNTNDLKKPGKYLAQLNFNGINDKYLEAYFSVVDNRKTDPKYELPTAKPGLTYNGREQVLINKGSAEGGQMRYKLGGGRYSTELPTATNAGTYTVYYKVVGDASHNDTAEQSITVKIGKAPLTGTPTFTPVTEAGKTIANVTLTAPTGWPAGTFYWMKGEIGLEPTTPITQGTPYRWLFIPDDKNYQSIGGNLVLWADTSGDSSSNPGGGNSSNTSGGSNPGGSSSDDGNTSDIGNSNNGSSNANIPPTPVTVPVSGDEKTIQVDAVVSGNTATIKNVDLSKLDTVIEDTAQNGVVTIDFSVLKKVDNVKFPSNVVKQIAEAVNEPDNDAKDLEIVLANGTSIKLDAKMLGEKNVKANGTDITISIKRITGSSLNIKQKQAVGSRPALDINVTIGGKPISDMNGKVTVSAAYELKPGEHASGIVVSYVDANGNRQLCETSYDPIRKQVSWKTGSLSPSSVYMIGYDESRVRAYVTYTVQKGSTLSMIAKKHGCTVADIMAANSGLIKNPNRIFVGWQLKIPQD